MASKGIVNRDLARKQLNKKFAVQRADLKEQLRHAWGDPAKVAALYDELRKMPLNSSPTRIHNRDVITGRPKAYMRKFGLCRLCFRKLALEGDITGVTKSSW